MHADDRWDDDEPGCPPESDAAGLDALGLCEPVEGESHDHRWGSEDRNVFDDRMDPHPEVFFTVSNPAGTISATAVLGGRAQRFDLTGAFKIDEAQLGGEIVELATLAREKALAAQHEVTVELMRSRGQDSVAVSAVLQHAIGLPTYEAASAHAADVFATRYRLNDD